MTFIKKIYFLVAILSYVNTSASDKNNTTRNARQHPLDIVFCLDLSGSTNGLIEDVREQLWTIINQAHAMEPVPDLRIGVIGFSRPSFGKETAYVKVLSDLTNDYDSLAYELYKLKPAIEKGDQYVNAALTVAMNEMNWGKEVNNSRIIFIVGNGLASIRGVDLEKTCEQLVKQRIVVNSLFVVSKGKAQLDAIIGWRRIADLTHGFQSEIAVGKKDVVMDLEMNYNQLIELNHQLNRTYIYHGEYGKQNYRRLNALDSALHLIGVTNYYQRAWYKLSPRFQNAQSHWDLVDYIKSLHGSMEEINPETLPDSLKNINTALLAPMIIVEKEKREKILRDINLLFKNNYIESIHQKYLNHEFPDGNIFSRSVINMLMKGWR